MCIALGDCGSKTNYLGTPGYHDGSAVYTGQNSTGGTSSSKDEKVFNY